MKIEVMRFIVIPRDAFELLSRRYGSLAEATAGAESDCAETGMAMNIVELKAVAARADRPVKVTKL